MLLNKKINKLKKKFTSGNITFNALRKASSIFVNLLRKARLTLARPLATICCIGAGSGVPGGAQAPPELFLAPPEPFEPPLTIEKIMH